MSAEYINSAYGLDYQVGDRIVFSYRGKHHGTIVSFFDQHLGVRFDGSPTVSRLHPTWKVKRAPAAEDRGES